MAAQRVIVSSLRKHWCRHDERRKNELSIVGEEDESVTINTVIDQESVLELDERLIDRVGLKFYLPKDDNLEDTSSSSLPPDMLDLDHLVLYVDLQSRKE